MLKAKKFSANGTEVGTVELPEELFGVQAKSASAANAVLYEVINMYLANQRQGNASTKTRGMVKGSNRKLFRQKGTGSARMGNVRTPVRVGGGVAFGPIPKDWYRTIPQKKKRLALKLALTDRAQAGRVIVVEDLNYDKPSTKAALTLLEKITPADGRKLVVIDGSHFTLVKSFANLPKVEMDRADCLYAYEVLKSRYVILTESALKKVTEVFSK